MAGRQEGREEGGGFAEWSLMEARTFIETFIDYLDAFHYLETVLQSYGDWEIKESSGIQYINHGWRVGISVERPISKPAQAELPFA